MIRFTISTRCLFLAAAVALRMHGAGLEIKGLEPTVLFPRRTPLAQRAHLVVDNRGPAVTADAVVTIAGQTISTPVPLLAGVSRSDILVPDIASPGELELRLVVAGEPAAKMRIAWSPQRKWKIYVVKSSHEDLGYENFIHKKQRQIADLVDLADDISRPAKVGNTTNTREDGYHYVLESLLFQRAYIAERGEAAWRRLVEEQLRGKGGLSLMGAPSGVHSHWMDYEELARMTYPARRESRDRFGLDLQTYMIVDNPSLSWSGAQVLAEAGFNYVARWGQAWRTGGHNDYATTHLPALFWWRAPDGIHRVLYGWRSSYALYFWYGQTGGGHIGESYGLPGEWVDRSLREIESGAALGPYPYDAVIVPSYTDHETPRFDKRAHTKWVEQFAYPEVIYADPTKFFRYIETRYGESLPVLSGDLNNFSADYATIDPESQDWKRRAARTLPVAEGLGVLATLRDPAYLLSPAAVDRTYTRLFDYDEHSWPTVPAVSDAQVFNAAWVKRRAARQALAETDAALAEAGAHFARGIGTGPEPTVAVFNPLLHVRTGLVEVAGDFPAVKDLRTGRRIPCQAAGDGRVEFVAPDLPAYGYALFAVDHEPVATEPAGETGPDWMANADYELHLDPATGGVTSLIERKTGREWVDRSAPHQLNQLVYVHTPDREAPPDLVYAPRHVQSISSTVGPVSVELQVKSNDPKTGAGLTQTIRLYRDLPRIDFVNRLEHVAVMHSDALGERYCDNLFFAFPLNVPGGVPRVEYPAGVVRPHDDQLPWGPQDFLFANHWVDVSTRDDGMTLVPENAGTVQFGGIRYNAFSNDYRPAKPWLYSYAWSNRMAGLLTLGPEDCRATFRYSLAPHAGDWTDGAPQIGWETTTPLVAWLLPAGQPGSWLEPARSFLAVDASNVQLTVLKPSARPGGGWVVRLVETAGRATTCRLNVDALGISAVHACDLVENDESALPLEAGRVACALPPFGHATLRLVAEANAVPAAPRPAVEAATDSTVSLAWPAAEGAAIAYDVFRSKDPAEPPTTQDWVARTGQTHFEDKGLDLRTRYFYRVAAVATGNLAGPPSAAVTADTAAENRTPPGPVTGLGIVRRSRRVLILYWRRSDVSDVARYCVYRRIPAEGREEELVAELPPSGYFLETFTDRGVKPGTSYRYRVIAEDWAGNRQEQSPTAEAMTPP